MASNEVRIIGGKWRGRKLVFPQRADLRPTLGRVRETLFNWLRADVADSRCLDLFAGSGALGFEALSRGAAEVTLVDRDRRVTESLADNAARLGADAAARVVCTPAERLLQRDPGPWDIVFLDPPFRFAALDELLRVLRTRALLSADGLVYVEAPGREAFAFSDWREVRHSHAGDTQFGLLATR